MPYSPYFAPLVSLLGFVLLVVAFAFYRRPGVRFWRVAPIWRANDFLFPMGVRLWWTSILIMWVGVALMLLS